MRKLVVMAAMALSLWGVRTEAQFPAAPGTGPGLAETIEAIDSARVTTRILYVTAHPDDERADVLTYLARGLHADVALLSLTRGEGGQNALGPEQAPQLGLIRTQELLAATRGYGVKLYFTRAKDFGYSKTPEETERIWGDQVLEDMVRVIREFRPNIVINNWGGVHGGHGHHQAAGLLTPIAVKLAGDAKTFPNLQEEGLDPWNGGISGIEILNLERGSEKPQGYLLPLDEVSPLYGKTWREIGLDAFANHRTQGISGFLGSPFLRRPIALLPEAGRKLQASNLSTNLSTLAGDESGLGCGEKPSYCGLIKKADEELASAHNAALAMKWKEASQLVANAGSIIASIIAECKPERFRRNPHDPFGYEIEHVEQRVNHAVKLTAGFRFAAESDRAYVVAAESFEVKTNRNCRPDAECRFEKTEVRLPDYSRQTGQGGDGAGVTAFDLAIIPEQLQSVRFNATLPETAPFVSAEQMTTVEGYRFGSTEPVTHISATSTRVDKMPLRIVPAYTLAVEPKQEIEKLAAKHEPFDVFLRVHSYSQKTATVKVGLDVPAGWKSSDAVELNFTGEGDRYAKLKVTPPAKLDAGHYAITAYAKRGEAKFTSSIEPLVSMPTLTWEEPAQTVVHAFDIKVPEHLRVGYISAESEPVPDALKMLGIQVEMLDANVLNFGDLSKYDAIVVGVRAYELRGELPGANQRLLDYAKNGGTLVVQYERDFAWDGKNYAPYPAKISPKQGDPLPRITDETSPVKFLKPDDPLLNTPNKLTQDDFKGWVQERGLYFWSEFDPQYTALLAMNDPGEKDLTGALVYTKYGKGTYIYTGIAFFRQLPEGVPGAYRLFVNLLAASRSH